jgi:hypothetical protein
VTSGDYRGRESVLGFFAKSVQIALPEFEIHDIVASDDHVVALSTIRWRRSDNDETFEDRVARSSISLTARWSRSGRWARTWPASMLSWRASLRRRSPSTGYGPGGSTAAT